MVKDSEIVGSALASVLPDYGKPWFKVPHLLKLNLILLVPLLSSAVAGYDGTFYLLSRISLSLSVTCADICVCAQDR